MPSNDSTELWFPVEDLLPIVEHCLTAPGHTTDPQHGDLPALHLSTQDDALFYLLADADEPTGEEAGRS